MAEPPTPPTPPPPGGRGGLLSDTLGRLLSYADRPWKAVLIVVVIILAGFGWVLYEKRDEILESWLTPSAPGLVPIGEISSEIEHLAAEIDVDLIQVWQIVGSNQKFLVARRKDGERPVIPEPRVLPIMDKESDPQKVAAVLAGYPICLDLLVSQTPLALRLAARDFKRGCAVAIPPYGVTLGVMYLVWHDPKGEGAENVAVGAAREVASKLSTH